MRILQASSEVFPYSKTGGLADMVGALAKALAELGHQVGVVTPLYRGIQQKFSDLKPFDLPIELPLGDDTVSARVLTANPLPNLTICFIDQPEFYDRPALYQENKRDYPDNAARFIFLAKCVAFLARKLELKPELVHVHDWQAGLVPLFIKHQKRNEKWRHAPASCLTIHNLAYQGNFPWESYRLANLPWDYFKPEGVEFYGGLNCLKAGIVYADMITTVSPRYAREITTEQYGCGLDGVLRARQDRLAGILNGVDYSEWNTKRNPFLAFPYSAEDLAGKMAQKAALQGEMGLPIRSDVPLFGTVSRLAEQKGIDIAIAALEEMLPSDMQFVALGSGEAEYEKGLKRLAERYPQKVAVRMGYDHALAHRIEAGCDFFLMPSRFEPCGLNQMYSLHYGTIPIVRVTGGLDDSVVDITEDVETADGIKFIEYSPRALAKAIRKALVLYQNPELMEHYRLNGMSNDFSWEHTCADYLKVYKRAIQLARKP
jgi:starch synthase